MREHPAPLEGAWRRELSRVWAIDHYDDGGISDGTMERPALQRLLTDIRGGFIDVVVVYKIDRLTRSLMDIARIVKVFDANDVSFVSVTQAHLTGVWKSTPRMFRACRGAFWLMESFFRTADGSALSGNDPVQTAVRSPVHRAFAG